MTKDQKIKFRHMVKELKEVNYIGEDGEMATTCTTKRGAWIKFRRQVREDCGDSDALDVELTDIHVAYARIATQKEIDEEIDDGEGYEWYVSSTDKPNSVICWRYGP